MKKALLSFSIILTITRGAFCVTFNPRDPGSDIIFYMDFTENGGTQAKDESVNGLTGTLANGPAWVIGDQARKELNSVSVATATAGFPGSYISFSGAGGSVSTPGTAILDFSGNKPFMIAITVKPKGGLGTDRTIMDWSDNVDGWSIHLTNVNQYSFLTFAIGEVRFTAIQTDNNPHTLGIYRNSGEFRFYYDGKLDSIYTGQSDLVTIAGGHTIDVGKKVGANSDFNGGIGRIIIWNKLLPREQLLSFFSSYHNMALGVNSK